MTVIDDGILVVVCRVPFLFLEKTTPLVVCGGVGQTVSY